MEPPSCHLATLSGGRLQMQLMVFLLTFLIVAPASAQTSEQTLLYMLHGFEGEAAFTGSPSTTSAQITTLPDTADGVRIDGRYEG